MIKKLLVILIVGWGSYAFYLSTLDLNDVPPLNDGDLIFQTSWTNQSIAIGLASGSWYIHTGIVKKGDKGLVVVEAGQTVGERPLQEWVDGGILKRFAIYRYRTLTAQQAADVLKAAKQYYYRPYDHYFSFDNRETYCSELLYDAFQDAGVPLGNLQEVGKLHINNYFTRKLIEQRWRNYPKCKDTDLTFEQCYDVIMSQPIITPVGIASDPHLDLLFSNYP